MFDLLILALLVAAAVGGYRRGLVARAASWAGLVLGLFAGVRLAPSAVESLVGDGSQLEVLVVSVGVVVLAASIGQGIGTFIGTRASVAITSPAARRIDAVSGATAGGVGVVVLVWLLLPLAADVTGWPARAVRNSRVVAALDNRLPTPPDATRALRRLLDDGFPQVFDDLTRSPEVGPVPGVSGIDDATTQRIAQSVVKVVGDACGGTQTGTGWVVQPGVVVTNAHVVAGEESTRLETQAGDVVDAVVVAFDPAVDIAVLRVPGLTAPALEVVTSAVGQSGAVFGHPRGRPLELSPFEIRQRVRAIGRDIYGQSGVTRDLLILATDIEPGDSGSPLVDGGGRVVGVVFATAPDRDGVGYAVSTADVADVVGRAGSSPVGPTPCSR